MIKFVLAVLTALITCMTPLYAQIKLEALRAEKLEVDPAIFSVFALQSYLGSYEYNNLNVERCEPTNILRFDTITDMQNTYRDLTRNYVTNDEDELVLSAFELQMANFSLRSQIEALDAQGVQHDLENFTTDDVLATLLNKHGMVIIGDFIYLWDDGCIVVKRRFNGCEDIAQMHEISQKLKDIAAEMEGAEESAALNELFHETSLTTESICHNSAFDFDAILNSEKPGNVVTRGAAGCGLSAVIKHTVISHDPATNKMRVRFEATGFDVPTTTVLQTLHFDGVTQSGQVEVVDGDWVVLVNLGANNPATNVDWFDELITNFGGAYPGSWVEVIIDGNLLPSLDVRLARVADLFSGNSCAAMDEITIDVLCPISLSAEQLHSSTGDFLFEVTGVQIPGNIQTSWRFGDGSVAVSQGQQGITHQFPQCGLLPYTVVATIEDKEGQLNLCANPVTREVEAGNPGLLERYREPAIKGRHDGKRFKLVSKIKPKSFVGFQTRKSKVKNKFKYRKLGEKRIESVGEIVVHIGADCERVDLQDQQRLSQLTTGSSSPNPETLNKKRKLKQKIKTRSRAYLDCREPYSVDYSHDNGFSQTVQLTPVCPQ